MKQRDNSRWFELRRGRLTASHFGYVLAVKQERSSKSLLKKALGKTCLDGLKSIECNISNEKEGIQCLELAVGIELSGL